MRSIAQGDDGKMIGDDIQRVEELRYRISSQTYELLRKKKRREPYNDLESELERMKREMSELTSRIAGSGYDYILLNKKRIDDLKTRFLSLDNSKRMMALEGQGEGGQILSEMLNLLLSNNERKSQISTLVLSLPSSREVVNGIRSVSEGYSSGTAVVLENDGAATRIANSLNALNVSAQARGKHIYLGTATPSIHPESVEPLEHEEHGEHGIHDISPGAESVLEDAAEESAPEPVPEHSSEISIVAPILIGEERPAPVSVLVPSVPFIPASSVKSVQLPQTERFTSEDLQPKLSYKETCEKIQQIMQNHKMKRWVLGAFKNEEEHGQYEKVQMVLLKLMRLKSSYEAKGLTR